MVVVDESDSDAFMFSFSVNLFFNFLQLLLRQINLAIIEKDLLIASTAGRVKAS